jgi:DNA recombination protein RmuC
MSVVAVIIGGMDISALLPLAVGLLLGAVVGVLWARSRASYDVAPAVLAGLERAADHAVVKEGLERLHDQMRDLEHNRVSWQGQLAQQVLDMRHTTDLLRVETRSLSSALRKPQVRGRWGEMHLRRAVELAGMVAHCDFVEQARLDDGGRRPDLVVNLAGGRQLVVDAKVPLDAFLDAGATDDDVREAHLQRHAAQLRSHVDGLSAKRYWRSLPTTPEFVVMFVPAESFLGAALDAGPDLIEYAAARQVVLATPTTLIALLRTVAHGWTHEALTDQAREIQRLGRELHDRLATLDSHFDQVGRSLNAAVGHYNHAMGSLESRVLVTARRFGELAGREGSDGELPAPRQVESAARSAPVRLRPAPRRGSDEADGPTPTVAM